MLPVKKKLVYCEDYFGDWLRSLKEQRAITAVRMRLDRAAHGNFGDHDYVGRGVWEMRIHFGPGYRLYYAERGREIVILLCGGTKRTQAKDIELAIRLWTAVKEEK